MNVQEAIGELFKMKSGLKTDPVAEAFFNYYAVADSLHRKGLRRFITTG